MTRTGKHSWMPTPYNKQEHRPKSASYIMPSRQDDLEKKRLRRQLDAYKQAAMENEAKLKQFQAMETKLLSAESLPELCSVLINSYKRAFGLTIVTLVLIDSSHQHEKLLNNPDTPKDMLAALQKHVHLVNDYDSLQALNELAVTTTLGEYRSAYAPFFGTGLNLQSVAILPMERHGLLLGYLCLGSDDPQRYTATSATDFLQRLAAMAAISLENAMNVEYLKQTGLMDPLTSANNRRYFFKRLEKEMARGQRHNHRVGCLYLDLDHFKQINDQYGHAAGDMVLVHATEIMASVIRTSDVLARLGGEEFAVILPEINDSRLSEVAERIRGTLAQSPCELTTDTEIKVTASIGTAMIDLSQAIGEPRQLGETLVNQADTALYQAKESGRNQVVDFHSLSADMTTLDR